MKKIGVFILFILIHVFLVGCGTAEYGEVSPLQIGKESIVDQTKADDAKKMVLTLEEVVEVKGVALEENIYIAPKVTQFARFRLKEIRRNSFDRIKKRYPEAKIHVSTDKKIFMELGKLEKQLRDKTISKKKLEERLKKLEEDMKG